MDERLLGETRREREAIAHLAKESVCDDDGQ
jgi:hypothetical protein